MAEPARRLATYEDLQKAPPHSIAQLVGGELHVRPRPAGPHALAASGLGVDLGSAFQRGRGGPGGWIIIDEPELHFGSDVVVPDLAGWHQETPPELDASHFTIPPVWVCEVLSPSSSALDRGPKADLYARAGIGYLWLVEPLERIIEAFQLQGSAWLRCGAWTGHTKARIPPFDAIELDLGPLWVQRRQ